MKLIAWMLATFLFASAGVADNIEGAYSAHSKAQFPTIVMDFGGTGQSILFVEVNSSKQQCLCETAKAMAAYAHSQIIKVGDDDPAQIALQNYLDNNIVAKDQICIVASAETYESCRAALAKLQSSPTLVLYDATASLLIGAAPDKIALDVIDFVAGNRKASMAAYDKPHGDRWWYVPNELTGE
ncbi:MAG TPA: hypothetical protein VMV83_03015 [Rectinemataceae bacterium]|nr:hypothetical protein [Rectinemataceae bacterium]